MSTPFEEIFYEIFNFQQKRRNCDKSADHQQSADIVIDKTFKHGVISFSVYSFIINYFLKIVNTFFYGTLTSVVCSGNASWCVAHACRYRDQQIRHAWVRCHEKNCYTCLHGKNRRATLVQSWARGRKIAKKIHFLAKWTNPSHYSLWKRDSRTQAPLTSLPVERRDSLPSLGSCGRICDSPHAIGVAQFIERFRGARHRSPDLAVALVNARGIACGVRTLTSLPYILILALEQDLVKYFF